MRFQHSFSVTYDIAVHFTRDVFAPDNELLLEVMAPGPLQRPARALVYVDAGCVADDPGLAHRIQVWFANQDPQRVALAAEVAVVPGGEAIKNDLAIVDRVTKDVLDHGICRHSYVIIIGGGAVLDAVGCAASLVHRGIRQIRIPSTVLAQADAGLGVKNGLNRFGAKNILGTFTPPHAILNDARFLDTLDARSWRSGIAEAFKVAIIKDRDFLAGLIAAAPSLRDRHQPTMEWMIRRCAALHLEHIATSGDPFEHGSSRPLDFGHWSAHRLEILSRHRLLHGEAVAIGVAIDLLYAVAIGRLARVEADEILIALETCGFRLYDEVLDHRDARGERLVISGLEQFREHLGGELTLAMPDGLGRRRDITSVELDLLESAVRCLSLRPEPNVERIKGPVTA